MERSNIVQLGARGCSLPLAVGPLLSTHLNLRMPWASPPPLSEGLLCGGRGEGNKDSKSVLKNSKIPNQGTGRSLCDPQSSFFP